MGGTTLQRGQSSDWGLEEAPWTTFPSGLGCSRKELGQIRRMVLVGQSGDISWKRGPLPERLTSLPLTLVHGRWLLCEVQEGSDQAGPV